MRGTAAWIRSLAGVAVLLGGLGLGIIVDSGPAAAQATQPTETVGGNVPGGALGTASDAEIWRAVRKGITGTVTIPDKKAAQLVQSEGDNWRAFRNGPLVDYGAWGLLVTIVLLAVFFAIRGRIRIDHGPAGRTIERFSSLERMAHWLLAVSFIVLALSGLNVTFGKLVLLPVIGKPAFATLTLAGKWLHNHVAFPFMVGLALTFLLWLRHNLPRRSDLAWIVQGGGLLFKGRHPPAGKFNAGQKLIFWSVVLGGLSLVLSGIALLFPFQTAMFAGTFEVLNVFGLGLPSELTALQEMQLATLWHAIVALVMIAIILAHIYIGTLGMEGAFDAMGSGQVDENWAQEHHSLWVAEQKARTSSRAAAAPAE